LIVGYTKLEAGRPIVLEPEPWGIATREGLDLEFVIWDLPYKQEQQTRIDIGNAERFHLDIQAHYQIPRPLTLGLNIIALMDQKTLVGFAIPSNKEYTLLDF
jgi:hypothetical protein